MARRGLIDRMRRRRTGGASERPTGTVTFVLTDIEGSTRLWETVPGLMERAIRRHARIVADAVARHGGTLVRERGEGDSTFSVFPHAPASVAAALELQSALTAEAWEAGAELRVRVALHTGDAYLIDEDEYASPVINRCARIREVAYGGQVLVSEHTAAIVGQDLPAGSTLRDLGPHRLRDLSRPVRIFQLQHPTLLDEFPRLRSLEAGLHNLPVQLTSFIGREREVGEVRKHLAATRVLSLTGPGGIGKTRLALQVAGELADAYPDGIWFVDLSTITDGRLVPQVLAKALSLREERDRSVVDSVIDHLRGAQALIAIDNCEHLNDATSQFATTLLRSCVEVSILATGREPLRVPGATNWRVPTMAVPDDSAPTESLGAYESIRLFTERAALVRPDFALTHSTGPVVARICRKLDGVPLAIELAAANVASMSPSDIESRLDDRFRTLVRGGPDVPRHETLLATVDWSHDLLTERERVLFRRLAVFSGGFSLEGAEDVCSDETLVRTEIVDLLTRLVDKSLVVPDDAVEQTRYGMLETIREYASSKLEGSSERDVIRRRHTRHFAVLAERLGERLESPDQAVLLDLYEADHDNFRRALEDAISHDRDQALCLAADLTRFWSLRGFWTEGTSWIARVLEDADAADHDARARALCAAGVLAFEQTRLADAKRSFEESLALLDETQGSTRAEVLTNLANVQHTLGAREEARAGYLAALEVADVDRNPRLVVAARAGLGTVALSAGELAEARECFERAIKIGREHGLRRPLAAPIANLGMVERGLGDTVRATALFTDALSIAREVGDRKLAAAMVGSLGELALERGDVDAASRSLEESLVLQREIGDAAGEALSLHRLGQLDARGGRLDDARARLDESLSRWTDVQMPEGIAYTSLELARLGRVQGRSQEAGAQVRRALETYLALGHNEAVVECIEVIAGLALDRSDAETCAQLLAFADAARAANGWHREPSTAAPVERDAAAARSAIGEEAHASAVEHGRNLTVEGATALATSDAQPKM